MSDTEQKKLGVFFVRQPLLAVSVQPNRRSDRTRGACGLQWMNISARGADDT